MLFPCDGLPLDPTSCLTGSSMFAKKLESSVLAVYNHGKKLFGHFCISWAFSNSCMPNPSPHPINNVGHVYPEFFYEFELYIGWREGELALICSNGG